VAGAALPPSLRTLEQQARQANTAAGWRQFADAAVKGASSDLSKACIKLLGDEAGGVSKIYDEITNHSLKKDPPAAKAVELAFEKYAKERAGK
jgi:uracil DNA glycosylase